MTGAATVARAGSGAEAGAGGLLDDGGNNGICRALHKLSRININFYATKAAAAATATATAVALPPNGATTPAATITISSGITIATCVAYRLQAPQSMQAVFHFAAVSVINTLYSRCNKVY